MENREWPHIHDDDIKVSDGKTFISGTSGDALLETNEKLVSASKHARSIRKAEEKGVTSKSKMDYAASAITTLKALTVGNDQTFRSFKEFLERYPIWEGTVTVDGTSTRTKMERLKAVEAVIEKKGARKVKVKMAG